MSGSIFMESVVESAAFTWLSELCWQVKYGPEIAPARLLAERQNYGQVVLNQRLRDVLPKLISGELRLPAALRDRAAQPGVKDAERFLKERGL
jgi:hypothetical protein